MMMKKNLFLAALAIVALASCTDSEFVGDNSPDNTPTANEKAINFGFDMQRVTRADVMGSAAATLLGNNFYVTGTKGTEGATYPTNDIVFNNYLIHYGVNTAATTESNTANWEYVNVVPGTDPTANYVKLSPVAIGAQTIKYWDYSTSQYDFMAFSTGTFKAVAKTNLTSSGEDQIATNEIGVTAMAYGSALNVASSVPTAYTFYLPSVNALKNAYITDITEVVKDNYGKEVTLKFKNLGSKVRIALYETVPGYSVKDVVFYKVDGTNSFTDGDEDATNDEDFKSSEAALISANTNGLPTRGSIAVIFPHVGNNNDSEKDYNKAAATVTPVTANSIKAQTFGNLHNFQSTEPGFYEAAGNYLGRNLTQATFAGDVNADYYTTVFPVSSPDPLTLRVDYTLVSTDGSGETITVHGAKAVVPSTYTKWLPNYAYTYIFKISDNTNGWTDPSGTTAAGLFPITFDAVVAEATDATAEQRTITTVATPTITTYQQGHNKDDNEYSIARGTGDDGRDVYVMVMDNRTTTATPVGATACTLPDLSATNSLLYAVSKDNATEAEVMDALLKRTSALSADNVNGRNNITLTKNTNISVVTTIVNGADDNPITLTKATDGHAAKIDLSELSAGTYAYVYDYTPASPVKTETTVYQPITLAVDATIPNGTKYITKDILDGITSTTSANEPVSSSYLYFSKTTNGSVTTTYSFVSVDGKTTLPAGLLKVEINSTNLKESDGTNTVAAGTICFDTYIRNDGSYAVKVIKVVA